MLVRNIDVTDGLMNGAVGTIKHLEFNSANQLTTIYVGFDNPSIGQKFLSSTTNSYCKTTKTVAIEKTKISVPIARKRNTTVMREQFPLVLSWAVTIHKSQSLTLDSTVIDFHTSAKHLQNGQIYVALSRVRSIRVSII